ncbi:hypothetical protein [Desulfosporosinus sp. SB140]|uniref:hypothetical protein n=1 Tax=Desulfosporosinus paludis TaxID=3115649 RepID=UPI00388E0FDD
MNLETQALFNLTVNSREVLDVIYYYYHLQDDKERIDSFAIWLKQYFYRLDNKEKVDWYELSKQLLETIKSDYIRFGD